MSHLIILKIPYGRVVEFRKWWKAHPHIVETVRLKEWEGSYGCPGHARIHRVFCTEERHMAFVKLAWGV